MYLNVPVAYRASNRSKIYLYFKIGQAFWRIDVTKLRSSVLFACSMTNVRKKIEEVKQKEGEGLCSLAYSKIFHFS